MKKNILILLTLLSATSIKSLFSQPVFPIEEQLAQTTIRIIVKKDTSTFVGTGFFFEFVNEGVKRNILVTNYHVISDVDTTILIFTKELDNRPQYEDHVQYLITGSRDKWIRHPDTTIDLCYLDLAPIVNDAKRKGMPLFLRSIDEKLIPKDSIWNTFTYLEEIIMIGYPNGLIDRKNNLPIIRMGTTASQPKFDFDGKHEFITDIFNFGGSSGSPIFIRRTPFKVSSKEEGKVSIGPKPEYYFVGIHYKGEYFDIRKSVSDEPTKDALEKEVVNKYKVPLSIGHVIKSYKVLDFKALLFPK